MDTSKKFRVCKYGVLNHYQDHFGAKFDIEVVIEMSYDIEKASK